MNLAVPDNLDSIVDRRKMYEYNKVETRPFQVLCKLKKLT